METLDTLARKGRELLLLGVVKTGRVYIPKYPDLYI